MRNYLCVDNGDHNNAVSPVANVETLEFTSLRCQPSPNVIFNLLPSTSMARPTTPKRTEPDLASVQTQSQVHLGKRAQANLSLQTGPQTRNSKKKKKVTDDNLAAIEAEKMVQAGSKRKRKATGRK